MHWLDKLLIFLTTRGLYNRFMRRHLTRARAAALVRNVLCSAVLLILIVISVVSLRIPLTNSKDVPLLFGLRILREFPHDPGAFTQGLEYFHGCQAAGQCQDYFWESTGLNNRSSVRQVEVATGRVVRLQSLPPQDFAEGITRLGGRLYQLTWKSPRAWVYPSDDLSKGSLVSTPLRDGWGITNDGAHLIAGDSSPVLSWIDPGTMALLRQVTVRDGTQSVAFLNELEWVNATLLANVWGRECLAQVAPQTGRVRAWIDARGITRHMLRTHPELRHVDVFNGIAWDAAGHRLFVTGKLWPVVYQIELVAKRFPTRKERRRALADVRAACIVTDTSVFDVVTPG